MSNPQLLSEGLKNLEDLDVTTFIDAVRRIGEMQATELLDGASLYFGLDGSSTFYTTRSSKIGTGEKYFKSSDYPFFAANNGFRAAHEALQAKEKDIKIALNGDDLVEVSILYGRQPNTVSYGLDGKNFISIVRGIEPTANSRVEELTSSIQNSDVVVKSIIVDTTDGVNLERKAVNQLFRFVGAQKIDSSSLKKVKLEKELKKLESYLDENSGIGTLTNFQLMSASLGSIEKDQRPEAKVVKDKVIAIVKNQYKLTIKKELLNKFVRNLKPSLGASDISGDEDLGIQGVILKDPESGEMLRLIDKTSFDTINDFNFAVRNQIAGLVRTTDDSASLESRGGITGQMKIRIAELLGNKDLAMSRSAKAIFSDNMGDTPVVTLKNVAKILNGSKDFNGVKRKIDAVVGATMDELTNMLSSFNKSKDSKDNPYRLRLKSGKTIGLSAEVIKRTNMTFAETRRNLQELKEKIVNAKSFDNLIAILYGRMAKQVHNSDESDTLSESFNTEIETDVTDLLVEARIFTDTARYKEVTNAQQLLQIYIATILMATVIYKSDDKHGQKLLRDKTNYRMAKYSDTMSALNFWGFAVWQADHPTVAKMLQPGVAGAINKITKKVPPQWVKNLHLDLSYAGDLHIDWADHFKTLRFLLQHSEGMAGIDRIVKMLDDVFNYENLSFDQKTKILPKVYFFGTQYVSTSPLLTRIRFIQNNLLGTGFDPLDDVTPSVVFAPGAEVNKLLGEDGEIDTGGDAEYSQTSSPTNARTTVAAAIASKDSKLGDTNRMTDGKRKIVKRKRNPEISFKKFARPKEED